MVFDQKGNHILPYETLEQLKNPFLIKSQFFQKIYTLSTYIKTHKFLVSDQKYFGRKTQLRFTFWKYVIFHVKLDCYLINLLLSLLLYYG